jgi:hypothetical protein
LDFDIFVPKKSLKKKTISRAAPGAPIIEFDVARDYIGTGETVNYH